MTTLITMAPAGSMELRADWAQECRESAAGQAQHVTLVAEDFFSGREKTYTYGGIVACLDWDDRLTPGAVSACEKAMESTKAGLAFTWQRRIGSEGEDLGAACNPVSRRMLGSLPDSVHHLACIRTEYLPRDLLPVFKAVAPLCIDWLVKAYVALKFGAVQVPMVGYEWRQHPDQASRKLAPEYRDQVPRARAMIRTWLPTGIEQTHDFPIWGGLEKGG